MKPSQIADSRISMNIFEKVLVSSKATLEAVAGVSQRRWLTQHLSQVTNASRLGN